MLDPVRTIAIFQEQPGPKSYKAGEVIFEQGTPADVMYGILEGEVEILFDGHPTEVLHAGEVFGVGALIQQINRLHTAIAKTDCKLAYLDQERFMFAIQETPAFALKVLKSYSDRLHQVGMASVQ